jgi:hypothetical protein
MKGAVGARRPGCQPPISPSTAEARTKAGHGASGSAWNDGGSHTRRNRVVKSALAGWGGRIRTHKRRLQNWPLKCGPNFPSFRKVWRSETFPAELPRSDLHLSPAHSAMKMARRSPSGAVKPCSSGGFSGIREFESSRPASTSASASFPPFCLWLLTTSNQIAARPWRSSSSLVFVSAVAIARRLIPLQQCGSDKTRER